MFRETQAILTHPMTVPLLLAALLVIAVFWTLMAVGPERKPREPRFSDNKALNALAWGAVILSPLGALILVAALWELVMLAWHFPTPDTPASEIRFHSSVMLAMLAAIGALFTLLFAYIKVFTTERQTRATEEGLIVERTFKAAHLLSSQDSSSRIAALHSLYQLGTNPLADFEMVTGVLAAHIRKLSAARPIDVFDDPIPEVKKGVRSRAYAEFSDLDVHNRQKLYRSWAKGLPRCDDEFQTAVTLFGRLPHNEKLRPDFKECNFQNVVFAGLDYSGANFSGAHFEGAKFENTHFARCTFAGGMESNEYSSEHETRFFVEEAARLSVAVFHRTNFEACNISGAVFDSSVFIETAFLGCDCSGASFMNAQLRDLQFESCLLYLTCFTQASDFNPSTFSACDIYSPIGIDPEEQSPGDRNTIHEPEFMLGHDRAKSRWREPYAK